MADAPSAAIPFAPEELSSVDGYTIHRDRSGKIFALCMGAEVRYVLLLTAQVTAQSAPAGGTAIVVLGLGPRDVGADIASKAPGWPQKLGLPPATEFLPMVSALTQVNASIPPDHILAPAQLQTTVGFTELAVSIPLSAAGIEAWRKALAATNGNPSHLGVLEVSFRGLAVGATNALGIGVQDVQKTAQVDLGSAIQQTPKDRISASDITIDAAKVWSWCCLAPTDYVLQFWGEWDDGTIKTPFHLPSLSQYIFTQAIDRPNGHSATIDYSYSIEFGNWIFGDTADWFSHTDVSGSLSSANGWGLMVLPERFVERHAIVLIPTRSDGTLVGSTNLYCLGDVSYNRSGLKVFVSSPLTRSGAATFAVPSDEAESGRILTLSFECFGGPVSGKGRISIAHDLPLGNRTHILHLDCDLGRLSLITPGPTARSEARPTSDLLPLRERGRR